MNRRKVMLRGSGAALVSILSLTHVRAQAVEKGTQDMKSVDLQNVKAFSDFYTLGGVIGFAAFDDIDGGEDVARRAIARTFADDESFDAAALDGLSGAVIDDLRFFGDWYDPADGSLIKEGTWKTKGGRELINPRLRALQGVPIEGGGHAIPDAGSGGQFAYAFFDTPYGLRGEPEHIQSVFDDVRTFILPPGETHEIRDWSSPKLAEVSEYFSAGMEWWGVFLFTIYLPKQRRLFVIAASTTD